MTLCLTDQETAAAASWSAKIDAVADALRDCGEGAAISGARVDYHFLPWSAGVGAASSLMDFRTMFGLWPARRIAALRIANHTYSFTRSPSRVTTEAVLDGGRIPAFVLVFDADTGRTLALLPDEMVQRDRVAATAAVGARLLARGESRSLGLIGTGRMAERYVAALASVLPIEKLRVFSRTPGHADAFARAMESEHAIEAGVAATAEAAAKADVVCVATNSREPVLRGEWLTPGTHVVTTNLAEPDASVFDAADVAVITCRDRDDGWKLEGKALPAQEPEIRRLLGGAWGESDVPRRALPLTGLPDLGDVMSGGGRGRQTSRDITYHVNQSAGIQFAAIAAAVLDGAVEAGLGVSLPDEMFSTGEPRRLVDTAVAAASSAGTTTTEASTT